LTGHTHEGDGLPKLCTGESKGLDGAKVLVVEDEFIIALDPALVLRDFGCQVVGPVGSVKAALELLGRERPDAALLDVNLLDGVVVPVAELLASTGVPFMLLTAYQPQHVDRSLLKQAPHLGKPISKAELRRSLREILGRAKE
jgi:CheY-like chemotaxis protein